MHRRAERLAGCGAARRARARAEIDRVAAFEAEALAVRERAQASERRASAMLAETRSHDPVERKHAGWRLEDEAAQLRIEAELLETRYLQGLHGALNIDPDVPEAHERLAAHYQARMREAERAHDALNAARFEALLGAHDRSGRYATWIRGDGAVSLITDPPGAAVRAVRLEHRDRLLVPTDTLVLGRTPLVEARLPRGSWVLHLELDGAEPTRYPVVVGRLEHWDGVPPGESEPEPIPLLSSGALGPDDVYVPAGWFQSGGDPDAVDALSPRRLWVDGIVVRRFPVTNAEYLSFLDALHATEPDAAVRCLPRDKALGGTMNRLDEGGTHTLGAGADGVPWDPAWPVVLVSHRDAVRFAAWMATETGAGWRLPHDQEWEKAGVGEGGAWRGWPSLPIRRRLRSRLGLRRRELRRPASLGRGGPVRGGRQRLRCA